MTTGYLPPSNAKQDDLFFFWIGKEKILLKKKNSQPENIGDVQWGQKSKTKITMIK